MVITNALFVCMLINSASGLILRKACQMKFDEDRKNTGGTIFQMLSLDNNPIESKKVDKIALHLWIIGVFVFFSCKTL
jgi:hypothetical protein